MDVTCPTLVVVAEKDTVNPPEQGVELYNAVASDKKQLYIEEKARHYDVYNGEHFDRVVSIQTDWFKAHL